MKKQVLVRLCAIDELDVFSGPIKEVIGKLQSYVDEYSLQATDLAIEAEPHHSVTLYYLVGNRIETDEELQKRLDKQEKAKAAKAKKIKNLEKKLKELKK